MTMLTKETILNNLKLLGAELKQLGLSGEILLTGGAAMSLVHSARDMTKDIDALYEPKTEINQLAQKIAEQENLQADWLNDSVKGFLVNNPPIENFLTLEGLKISVVSPEYLLAMKLMSARVGETDIGDIKFLFKKLGIDTKEKANTVLTKFYPPDAILPKTRYVIEECLGRDET